MKPGWVAALLIVVSSCGGATPAASPPPVAPVAPAAPAAGAPQVPIASEKLAADTPRTTTTGTSFVAPGGWTLTERGQVIVLDPPEPGSHVALVDVTAPDADAAVARAWTAYDPTVALASAATADHPGRDGWDSLRVYSYLTSPAQHRDVSAVAYRHGASSTVVIQDFDEGLAQKRLAQLRVIGDRLWAPGYHRESFAGRPAHALDAARIDELLKFVAQAQTALGIPGVSIGLIQGGKVIYAGGLGVRELGKPAKPDADTLYMIASNTKAMTTLLLAELVDDRKLTWDTPVAELLPSFKLGTDDITRQVLVKHLVCACTGLPRQDYEWLLEFKHATAATELATLSTIQPTSKFGEMFQYSNLLAAAGGFVAAHVIAPNTELGAAYRQAMQARVFGPLGMRATTFDFARALAANHASPHAFDLDAAPRLAEMSANYAAVPIQPAGGAWSNVKDMLRFVELELGAGMLDGKRVVSEAAILARRAPQVSVGADETYGMGLEVDHASGIPVVHHGGSMIGYKSDMIWLPDHGIGAVILTNSDTGRPLLRAFRRRLLELVFDGKPEAADDLAANAAALRANYASLRKQLTLPADPAQVKGLAPHYHNAALGDLDVVSAHGQTVFDFGEIKSDVATRANDDGTRSLLTISPGVDGSEFLPGTADGKRTLTLRDAQQSYVFTERR